MSGKWIIAWRSAPLALLALIVALVIGVPLFVRMPPWCDLTLYDVAARTVIAGGTHFEDVFDTNLPGFLWCLIGIRRMFGTSFEAVRIVDLIVVATITALLMRFVRKQGADWAATLWLAACVALFYPFTNEFSHCQRDIWMTLPVLLAVMVRLKSLEHYTFRRSVLEGVLWGVAVWFKPHVLVIAAGIWLVTLKKRGGDWKRDLKGNLLGGVLIGLLGSAALIITGTWKPMMVVMTKWNQGYILAVWSETPAVFLRMPRMFAPWSLLHFAGLPLAVRAVMRMNRETRWFDRGVLAALYLIVLAQACLLQRNFDYVHIPEMLLLFAVLTLEAPRLPAVAAILLGVSTLLAMYVVPGNLLWRHAISSPRTKLWSECFQADLPPRQYRERQQRLGLSPEYFSAINVVELGEVADWLRVKGVQDFELLAWHDTPHWLYLELGLRPPFRFMHITTTLISDANFERMTIELKKKTLPRAKYIVTDVMHPMRWIEDEKEFAKRLESGPDKLPPCFPPKLRASWPWNQPAVFRCGRYVVHEIVDRNPETLEFHVGWE